MVCLVGQCCSLALLLLCGCLFPFLPFHCSLNFPSDKEHSAHTWSDNTSAATLLFLPPFAWNWGCDCRTTILFLGYGKGKKMK